MLGTISSVSAPSGGALIGRLAEGRPRLAVCLGAVLLSLQTVAARAETTVCTVISSLPATITSSGNYCLTSTLIYAGPGAAITINAGSVVLDLNGFTIGGSGAGFGTQSYGIFASNRKNITIRNGTIRGYYKGIYLEDAGANNVNKGHVVEGMRLDQNRYVGVHSQGLGNVVRDCQVVDTGGTTVFGTNADAVGIWMEGPGGRAMNNDVSGTFRLGSGAASGIQFGRADGSVVENNRIGNATATGATGIKISTGDAQVVANRMTTLDFGVVYAGTGKYRDNLTSGVGTPYTGGSDGGNNN